MNEKTRRPRLRLHRETIRTLSADRLARVAGGTFELFARSDLHEGNRMEQPQPKSNGWTGGSGGGVDQPTC